MKLLVLLVAWLLEVRVDLLLPRFYTLEVLLGPIDVGLDLLEVSKSFDSLDRSQKWLVVAPLSAFLAQHRGNLK